MRPLYGLIVCLCLVAMLFLSTGCQSNIGGQTLPSGYYLDDDVQYFAPAARNPLQGESAKLKAK